MSQDQSEDATRQSQKDEVYDAIRSIQQRARERVTSTPKQIQAIQGNQIQRLKFEAKPNKADKKEAPAAADKSNFPQ